MVFRSNHCTLPAVAGLVAFAVAVAGAHASSAPARPAADAATADTLNDTALVRQHVRVLGHTTWREPSGVLRYPYLVPAGPYNQVWDWDSLFLGVATLPFGSLPYFDGVWKNFLSLTNLTADGVGLVQGCYTPAGGTGAIPHAKPVIVQGAWLAAKANGSEAAFDAFRPFERQMAGLLKFYDVAPRIDARTQLRTWYDQLESGADNMVTSQCPSPLSQCWIAAADANTLASADMHVFLYREHRAYQLFLQHWAAAERRRADAGASLGGASRLRLRLRRWEAEAARSRATAAEILAAMQRHLWSNATGCYGAYNTSTGEAVDNRVYLMGLPLWGGLATATQAASIVEQLSQGDMLSSWGVRSTSSADARYSNANEIVPYSNWRGPVWVNANAMLAFGLVNKAYAAVPRARSVASQIAKSVVATLAADLRATNTWHEAYSSADGKGLAAPGFLSWDTLGAELEANVAAGVDPFALEA